MLTHIRLSLPHTLHTPHTLHPLTDLPAIPPMQESEPEDMDSENDDSVEEEQESKFKRTSGPKVTDPYASDDSWFMPITIAIAVFLPVLFCLCRVR